MWFGRGIKEVAATVYQFPGFSTLLCNSGRSYIRNFWSKSTAKTAPGHLNQYHRLLRYNKNLRIRIENPRPSEIKRLRKTGYDARMKYETGRKMVMENILKGRRKYAEFF